ncbi:MAG: PIN domain-containing protein [Bacillota bacterium]|nr:PIN domain-containing protein [Bacillota bacterium]
MTGVFIDTSALLALLSSNDIYHESAKATWNELLDSEVDLVTSNYVVVETMALTQRRLGMDALQAFWECMCPILEIEWVDVIAHDSAVAALLSANRRGLSLVDCTSFILMRWLGIMKSFTFDCHFLEQGFSCLPEMRLHDRVGT